MIIILVLLNRVWHHILELVFENFYIHIECFDWVFLDQIDANILELDINDLK